MDLVQNAEDILEKKLMLLNTNMFTLIPAVATQWLPLPYQSHRSARETITHILSFVKRKKEEECKLLPDPIGMLSVIQISRFELVSSLRYDLTLLMIYGIINNFLLSV